MVIVCGAVLLLLPLHGAEAAEGHDQWGANTDKQWKREAVMSGCEAER